MARLAPPIACALALLACFVALSLGQTLPPPPIPSHSPGHGYHSHSAPGAAVHVTAFFDFQCPDSRDAWTQWQSVFASLSYAELRFSLVSFALPYHRKYVPLHYFSLAPFSFLSPPIGSPFSVARSGLSSASRSAHSSAIT
eukprot:TRINITY_DN4005_c0_g1_i4.p1 TRINITY_DN4005_c0_g1~~TRINITY_DN4005_c0_g1_i4.p1  ORF type:complete len:141 (+),score=13.37 TRINITY_DN4005_c0_g1_i4:44-466(+)